AGRAALRLGPGARPVNQPWATLFAGYENHWFFKRHLAGHVPDWAAIMGDPDRACLSSGEAILLSVGLAILNGDRTATISDVIDGLDRAHRNRVLAALGCCP
ncbi:MAG: hypothetical protein ACRDYV_03235, partial [Acidimicrobiia bacterium]